MTTAGTRRVRRSHQSLGRWRHLGPCPEGLWQWACGAALEPAFQAALQGPVFPVLGPGADQGPPGPACHYVIGLVEGDSPHGSSVFGSCWAGWSVRAPQLLASIPGVPRVRTKWAAFPPRVPASQRKAPRLAHALGCARPALCPTSPRFASAHARGGVPGPCLRLASGVCCAGWVSAGPQALLGAPWGTERVLTAPCYLNGGGCRRGGRADQLAPSLGARRGSDIPKPPLWRLCWGHGAEP